MGRLALQQLDNKGVKQVYLMNRTHEKAMELAKETQAIPVGFWDIKDILEQSDVCICSAGAPHYLIDADLVHRTMCQRQGRPLVCVDISVPRNIAPQVAGIQGVSLVTVDDLDKVVEDNLQRRLSSVSEVRSMIDAKIEEFHKCIFKINSIQDQARNYVREGL
jgi:glutamyl-tRNA reductase